MFELSGLYGRKKEVDVWGAPGGPPGRLQVARRRWKFRQVKEDDGLPEIAV